MNLPSATPGVPRLVHPIAFLRHLFSRRREPLLAVRILQMLCLGACFVCLMVFPINLLQHLSIYQSLAIPPFGLVCLGIYRASMRGRHYLKTFSLTMLLFLDVSWYTGGGSLGSIGLFYFLAVMSICIFFQGWRRWAFLGLTLANVATLLTLDYYHPGWSIPFANPQARHLEILVGSLQSLVACLLLLLVVMVSYDKEKESLAETNQRLKQSLAEIETLKGLLPICAMCKKVRSDEGLWTQVEHYLAERSEISFSHGMCPECAGKHFPKFTKSDSREAQEA